MQLGCTCFVQRLRYKQDSEDQALDARAIDVKLVVTKAFAEEHNVERGG